MAREFGETTHEAKQMTAQNVTGAADALKWSEVDWKQTKQRVRRLQMRIAKAMNEKRYNKVKVLQRLLTHSLSAKLLAVKRVTSNQGKHTPGIDGVCWKTHEEKVAAIKLLKRHGYCAQPLRRVYIPKKNGERRPLSIPTMHDRAMQALYLLALEPIAETRADLHSYGFRPYRSCHDAIQQCFLRMRGNATARWVLEGDIKGCFDNISHDWLRQHIIIDKHMLNQWLQAGYLHEGKYYDAKSGVPQGGVISATLANMVLDGMSEAIDNSVGKRGQVGLIRYADDFIVTASNQTILTEKVQPAIERFLNSRGLSLSPEKTKITAIETGFDFLGFNVRHYKGKLLIKPAKQAIKAILLTLKQRVKDNLHLTPGQLIRHLNPIIQGWCNYYKHVVAKKTFYYLQHRVFLLLMYWIKRRHPNKSVGWRVKKYFIRQGTRAWVFSGTVQTQKAGTKKVTLYAAGDTVIKRHVKVRAQANPFLPEYFGYFRMRLAHYLKHANWRNRIINNDLCKA